MQEEPDCKTLLDAGIGLTVVGVSFTITRKTFFKDYNSDVIQLMQQLAYVCIGVGAILIVSAETGTGCRETPR